MVCNYLMNTSMNQALVQGVKTKFQYLFFFDGMANNFLMKLNENLRSELII